MGLTVLTEQAEQEAIRAKRSAHQQHSMTLGMLQQSERRAEPPQDLLQAWLSSFDDLANEAPNQE